MPRKARERSITGIYHIMMRGINRQNIFEDEEDCERFIQALKQYKEKCGYKIYAYCLMGNHLHILMKVGNEPLEQIMRRICGSYVYWYNWKYGRIGNLFQDRFKSEPVENDIYFLTVMRYIHQNPIKAGISAKVEDYKWSSYSEYISKPKVADIIFALNLFNSDSQKAIDQFIRHHSVSNKDSCLDIEGRNRLTDTGARKIINQEFKMKSPTDLQEIDPATRNFILKQLKQKHGLSTRQLGRLTGISRRVILKS